MYPIDYESESRSGEKVNWNLYVKLARNFSVANHDSKVLILDFRLKPKFLYPAMLEDSVDAYQTLLKKGLPRLLMIAASTERPLSDTIDFGEDAKKADVDVTTQIYIFLHFIKHLNAF